MVDLSAVGQHHPYPVEQNSSDCWQAIHYTLHSVSPAGNRCHFVLMDKDESCSTTDLPNVLINSERTKMFDTIGKPTYLLPEVVVKLS